MPTHPTLDQRMNWHIDHARHCSCRPMPRKVLDEAKERYLGTHQEFWLFFTRDDHAALVNWAAECAEHVLPLFEAACPHDTRPQEAIHTLREWVKTQRFSMQVIRKASLDAHAAAREIEKTDPAACFAARSAGQAVGTAHVPTHAMGAALYAIKAIAASKPGEATISIDAERAWQVQQLPENLRQWVVGKLNEDQKLLPRNLRI